MLREAAVDSQSVPAGSLKIFLPDYDYYDLLHTVLPTRMPLRDYYAAFSKLYGAIEPLRRGIAGYGENLDELVVKNLRKVMSSMKEKSLTVVPT
jgi:hypothetical protein